MKPYKKSAYKLLHDGAITLAEIEGNGIQIDMVYLEKAIMETEEKIQGLQKELYTGEVAKMWKKVYKRKTNFNSTDQLGKVLFEHMGIEAKTFTATGKYKTDEKALSVIDHPFVEKYIKIKKLQKAVTTYLKGIHKEVIDGLLHPFFNLHTTKTFRGSSDSPNFQNIPIRDKELGKLIRKSFIARPGNHLVELDYGSLEVRIAACYHKDPQMIKYISDPTKDMHRDMAMECYKLEKNQVTKDVRFYTKNCFVFPEFYGSTYIDCARNLWEAIMTSDLKTESGISLKKHLRKKGIKTLGKCNFQERPRVGTFEYHIAQVEKHFWEKRFPHYANWKKKWYYKFQSREERCIN